MTEIEAIRARLEKRREDWIATCESCRRTYPLPRSCNGPTPRCPHCGHGSYSTTMTLGETGPTPDEDIATLLELLREDAAGVSAAPSGWQPIETAPTDHEGPPILTWDGEVHLTTRGFTASERRAGWFDERGWLIHPTHWQPLPAGPPRCDHKFVDSTVCLKCGWKPAGPSPQEAR